MCLRYAFRWYSTFQADSLRDLIDAFIHERSLADSDPSFRGSRGHENMLTSINDLFVAGSDTTANTVMWVIYYLAGNRTSQAKAHKELDSVLGKDRAPTLSDREHCHYLEAIVQETHRISSLGFIGVPRAASKDTTLGPYIIPEGTQVFAFLHSVLHDREYWGDPETFRPERFLDGEGRYRQDDRNIAFGVGKRSCLGKGLAQIELFLFLSGLLQAFEFSFPEGEEEPRLEPLVGFVLGCPDYRVVARERRTDKP